MFGVLFCGRTDARGAPPAKCNHEPATLAHYERRLKGKISLGICPLLDDGMCFWAAASNKDIAILVTHDADISGYEIAKTLGSEGRTNRGMYIDGIDLGITVKEALNMGLEVESVFIQKHPSYEFWDRLASKEKEFLLDERSWHGGWQGRRVELNAMATDQPISWLESNLKELGLETKVLPASRSLWLKPGQALRVGGRLVRAVINLLKIGGTSFVQLSFKYCSDPVQI